MVVLPAALLGGILVCFPLHWIIVLKFTNDPDCMFTNAQGVSQLYLHRDDIERFLVPLATSITFVIAGARVAPKYHFRTGSVLASLYCLFAGFGAYVMANNSCNNAIVPNYWGIPVGISGALLGLWIVRIKSPYWIAA